MGKDFIHRTLDTIWDDNDKEKEMENGTVIDLAARIYGRDVEIGSGCWIGPGAYIRGNVKIGDHCWIGPNVCLHGEGGLVIGNDVGIGSNAVILTCQHTLEGTGHIINNPLKCAPIEIGDGCDIGVGAILLPGCKLGKGVQVGAGVLIRQLKPGASITDNSVLTRTEIGVSGIVGWMRKEQ